MSDAYIHGFTEQEQARLLAQATFLAPWVYGELPIPARGLLLELGAGVGGQTRELLSRTQAQIVTVELDPRQVATQRRVLDLHIGEGRVLALRTDATNLPLRDASVDGAFVCWLLEHVSDARGVVDAAFRALKPAAQISITEVQNQSLTLLPRDEALHQLWGEVNATQSHFGGDPFVGARLGTLLSRSGYTDIRIRFVPVHADARDDSKRLEILGYFRELLYSAMPAVTAHFGGSESARREIIDAAFDRASDAKDGVFLYTFARATARKPA